MLSRLAKRARLLMSPDITHLLRFTKVLNCMSLRCPPHARPRRLFDIQLTYVTLYCTFGSEPGAGDENAYRLQAGVCRSVCCVHATPADAHSPVGQAAVSGAGCISGRDFGHQSKTLAVALVEGATALYEEMTIWSSSRHDQDMASCYHKPSLPRSMIATVLSHLIHR